MQEAAVQTSFQRIGRWLWILAALGGIVGLFGVAGFSQAGFAGKLVLIAPHIVGVAVTALGGYYHPWAGVVGLGGSVLMAGLSWWDKLGRLTEGFEWQFNNAFSGAFCCGANYLVLGTVVCVMCGMAAAADRK